jgi:hypothetical protein
MRLFKGKTIAAYRTVVARLEEHLRPLADSVDKWVDDTDSCIVLSMI